MSETFEQMTFTRILESFAARTPTPGGGAAAGLSAAMGVSLAAMAMRFSVPRKVAEHELLDLAAGLEEGALEMTRAADADCIAYDRVREAFRLPKESDDEKAARSQAIHRATLGALASPLELMRRILVHLETLAGKAGEIKEMLASDMISAGWALRAGCEMAWQNVKINAEGLGDDPVGRRALAEGEELRARAAALVEDLAG